MFLGVSIHTWQPCCQSSSEAPAWFHWLCSTGGYPHLPLGPHLCPSEELQEAWGVSHSPPICGALRHPNQVRTPVPRCRVSGIQLMSLLFLKNTHKITFICCSVAKSWPTLQPHVLQHGRLPCPSLFPRVCSDSCTLSLVMSSNHLILYSCLLHLP